MRVEIVLALSCVLLHPSPLSAQDQAALPADVETVASGGYWEVNDSTHGQYRVVIQTAGFEHLISGAYVDWIAEATKSDTPPRLLSTMTIPEVTRGWVHLTNPVLEREGKRWILTLDATNTHCDPLRIDRWRVALGAPGQLTVLGSSPLQAGCE